ncbi:hypothetical protein [Ktedonobacter racemifer]|uniref:Uncharacterized protein n=1 Tax=Ktedonobacter racemifer DSM 44963 TaxID=485913 RepID=D6U552_KTERA|nr:hypothetical protein [Ktedonobacter racemifer]EFH81632.1 hypothetical protein Krac_2368 [Ktedonobacter racemifer DSM 44963]
MKEANAALRRLEELFRDHSEVDTASLVVQWADEFRTEYENRIKRSQEAARAQASMQYYGLTETQWRKEASGTISRYNVATHRIKPEDFPAFCKSRNLNEKKLLAVAVGDEGMYEGYTRAPMNGFMLGHEYHPKNEDALPPLPKRPRVRLFPEPKPEGKQYGTSQPFGEGARS